MHTLVPRPSIHTCRHPARHRLRTFTVCLGWLVANVYLAVPCLLWLSGGSATVFFLSLFGWLFLGIPFGYTFLRGLSRGACQQTSLLAPGQARHIERVILSPEAAQERFGVYGTVVLERESS